MVCFFGEHCQRFPGGSLFRFLFALSYSAAGKLSLDPYFHLELFLMIRAGLGYNAVFRKLFEPLLAALLELRLIIKRSAGSAGLLYHLFEKADDERLRGIFACIEIDGCNERLKTVGKQRILVPSAGLIFSFAEQEIVAEPDLAGKRRRGQVRSRLPP